MSGPSGITGRPGVEIPPDDTQRVLTLAQPDKDQSLPHFGVVGDTYTTLLTGDDTNGRFCLIDMHIPPGGGPPPHRHDFEEDVHHSGRRAGGYFSRPEVGCSRRRHREYPIERTAPIS